MLCTNSRASTSRLLPVGSRHRRRSPNRAFSVANRDSAALRRWYHDPNHFGNWRAKRLIRSNASPGGVGQRAFSIGGRRAALPHVVPRVARSAPIRSVPPERLRGGTVRDVLQQGLELGRVVPSAPTSADRRGGPRRRPGEAWIFAKSLRASGSWFDLYAQSRRARPVASALRAETTRPFWRV